MLIDSRADLADAQNHWEDAFCPYNFLRGPGHDLDSWITYSRIRGAIDGMFVADVCCFKLALFYGADLLNQIRTCI